MSLSKLAGELIHDERGQDVVEYTLLTAFFGLCALLAWTSIRDALGVTYRGASDGVSGGSSVWDTPPPGGSSGS